MTATQDTTIAELQRANAELRRARHVSELERDAASARQAALAEELAARDAELALRTAELAQRNSEFGERIEQQAATIDVLKVMSASPGDAQQVFRLVVERARAFCEADGATLALLNGDMLHLQAFTGLFEQNYEAQFPRPVSSATMFGRAILACDVVQIADASKDPDYYTRRRALRAIIAVPLLRAGVPIGAIAIARGRPGEFSAAEVELLRTFAEQAVIAITSAETYRALQTRTSDLQESLEYQTATSDVLRVISRSTFDLQPVLDTVVETAARLCNADMAVIARREGDLLWGAAYYGYSPEYRAWVESLGAKPIDSNNTVGYRAVREGRVVHVHDVAADPDYLPELIALGKQRTSLGVPLLRQGETIGMIVLSRQRVEPFTKRQIELVSTFADQAVIAIENTRLITEQREALEQQTATADLLQIINASPGSLEPVFDALLEKSLRLCEAEIGILHTYDGELLRLVATRGVPHAHVDFLMKSNQPPPGGYIDRIVHGENVLHLYDVKDSDAYRSGDEHRRAHVDLGGARTSVYVALRKDNTLLGVIVIFRQEVRPFSDKNIALLRNFASQAVIAMENARLLNEVRQRQEELRITFENMGDGVALFDETRHLVASNQRFQHMLDVPDDLIASRPAFSDYIRYLADHGEYGPEPEDHVQQLLALGSQRRTFERTRPNGRIIEIRVNPVPGGGFVVIYSDITERKRSEEEIRAARDAAEDASRTIEAAYRDLKAAQANLIQAEKMASLGQLTAGIAHEIKNPLNFVNNFAELSGDLLDELNDAVAGNRQAEIDELRATLQGNLAKITEHGKRADGIVKAMLEHSRGSSGERRMVDLNALIDEALNLAYHGARAQDQSFNITLERDFAEGIAPIELAPQDMTRVFLNLFSNGFYATTRRARDAADARFEPTLKVATTDVGDAVEIRVRDNGTGIPADIRDKLFQPFFTTKPTGEGTGLGLSITYDIVTQQHGGSITVDSKVGEYSEFQIILPRRMVANEGGRA